MTEDCLHKYEPTEPERSVRLTHYVKMIVTDIRRNARFERPKHHFIQTHLIKQVHACVHDHEQKQFQKFKNRDLDMRRLIMIT